VPYFKLGEIIKPIEGRGKRSIITEKLRERHVLGYDIICLKALL